MLEARPPSSAVITLRWAPCKISGSLGSRDPHQTSCKKATHTQTVMCQAYVQTTTWLSVALWLVAKFAPPRSNNQVPGAYGGRGRALIERGHMFRIVLVATLLSAAPVMAKAEEEPPIAPDQEHATVPFDLDFAKRLWDSAKTLEDIQGLAGSGGKSPHLPKEASRASNITGSATGRVATQTPCRSSCTRTAALALCSASRMTREGAL